jgi:two-component system NarL family response regulator
MEGSAPIRVMIVDDHPIVRDGIAALIERSSDLCLVAEAADGGQAVSLFARHKPDVTIMDMRMPVLSGVEAIAAIRETFPDARIIVLTTYDGDQDIYSGMRAGARGYLLKDASGHELLEAIRLVFHGQTCMPPIVAAKLAAHISRPELTSREMEVLRAIARGASNLEVANKLFIAEGTVKAHVNSILNKMGVGDRTSAVTQAIQRGIVQLS